MIRCRANFGATTNFKQVIFHTSNMTEELSQQEIQRRDWVIQMRLKLTNPEMLNSDGTLCQEPRKLAEAKKRWGDREKKLLIAGITKHGVGNWGPIKDDSLAEWDSTELRVKTAMLFGRQSLKNYKGKKYTEAEIEKEHAENKRIGQETGQWKGGVLVATDEYNNT
ncbi:hypothetical protein PROFUN_04471 [Planoprotostelium fungivorum]|uniref:Myb-like domain-containing protein n=1 Tax=Planoprotostelium fungivorum TaxID=1890364 RepID=A0A2P6NVQ4_9EUKA|nr:hypothetical protein PROFUN_04471 [Planoprotostelium fungivorum]